MSQDPTGESNIDPLASDLVRRDLFQKDETDAIDLVDEPNGNEDDTSASVAGRQKIYGLPIVEVENLLAMQQQVQALSFKIVRHLRAGEDKIASIKAEKRSLLDELAQSRSAMNQVVEESKQRLATLAEENEKLKQSVIEEQAAHQQTRREIESLVQQSEDQAKQLANQAELVEGLKKKILEYGNLRNQLAALGKQRILEREQLAAFKSRDDAFQSEKQALQSEIESAKSEREELLKLMRQAMAHLEKSRKSAVGPTPNETSSG